MIYKLGECSYCGNTYLITRPTPFMADVASYDVQNMLEERGGIDE